MNLSADPLTVVRAERVLPAPPARVFAAWTTPSAIRFWFGGSDMPVDEVEVDLRVGGHYAIHYRDAGGDETVVSGTYLEIVRPSRLVFSWTVTSRQLVVDENVVTVEFRDLGGRTEVRLVHEPFPDPATRRLHAQGWGLCLEAMDQLLS